MRFFPHFFLVGLISLGMLSCSRRGASPPRLTVALALFPSEAYRYRAFAGALGRQVGAQIHLIAQSYGVIFQTLSAESRAGRGKLDLVEVDVSTLAGALPYVRPLPLRLREAGAALFPPAAWKAASFGGKLYFVPHRLMWQAMIYNRRYVPAPPETWEALADFARQHPGRLALKGARYPGLICDVFPFFWQSGGSELAPGAPATLRALDYLQHLGPYLNRHSPVFREMAILEAQARGSVWIHFNWPFAMRYLREKGLAPQENLSAPLPAGPAGRASVLGGGFLAIPRSAPHPATALAFLELLMRRSSQRRLLQIAGWSLSGAQGSQEQLLYSGFAAMAPYVRARATPKDYYRFSNRWERVIRNIVFNGEPPVVATRNFAVKKLAR